MFTRGMTYAVVLAVAGALGGAAQAELINVQFGGGFPQQSVPFTGAALIGSAGDLWNYQQSGSGSNIALNNASGGASGLTLTYASQGAWGLNGGSGFGGTPYQDLMQGFIYTGGGPITLTIEGLSAGQAFNLFIYGQSDFGSPSYGGTVTVNGASQTALQFNANTFINQVNYLQFQGVADALGRVEISNARAPGRGQTMVNGFQLEVTSIPAPAAGLLILVGALIAGAARRTTA